MKKIQILSFKTEPDKTKEHYTFWRDGICEALCEKIAEILCLEKDIETAVDYEIVPHGGGHIKVESERHDIAISPYAWFPDKRPADFIFTVASDVEGYQQQMIEWQNHVRPNVIGCLQDMPTWLKRWGELNNCRVIKLPWFVFEEIPYAEKRDVVAFCSGAIGNTYPMRTMIYHALDALREKHDMNHERKIILSCGSFGKYPLTTFEYHTTLNQARYYCSGGIKNRMIPPKYFEAMNAGCCLVTPVLDWFKELGFVNGKTHIEIKEVDELEDIIFSDRWKEIGQEGKFLIEGFHRVENRARRILGIYYEYINQRP